MTDDYDALKTQYDEMAAKDLRRKIAEWAASPEAEAEFQKIAVAIDANERQMQNARSELHKLMLKPTSI
jgi:hypothetical protein